MARPKRSDTISADESCIAHVISRVVRRCFLLGDDPVTGNGFLNMSASDYLQLLDWTARQPVAGKPGVTPADTPAILWERHFSHYVPITDLMHALSYAYVAANACGTTVEDG